MFKRADLVLLVTVALAFVAFYWLMRDNRAGDAPPHSLAIAELRALAASLPGEAPTRIEAQLVGTRETPRDLIAAGSGLRPALLGTMAYRLERPGGGPIVIDSGLRRGTARVLGMRSYNPRNQARVEEALRRSSLVLLTSERAEHSGGVRALTEAKPGSVRAALNPAQLRPAGFDPATPGAAALDGRGPRAVAPGVVVVPTPEITPGAQMIYVRLANGREYLFTGDAAILDRNWRELRAPARLSGLLTHLPKRDRTFAWLKTIRALKREAPAMLIVPGHDLPYLNLGAEGRPLMKFGFTPEPGVSPGGRMATR